MGTASIMLGYPSTTVCAEDRGFQHVSGVGRVNDGYGPFIQLGLLDQADDLRNENRPEEDERNRRCNQLVLEDDAFRIDIDMVPLRFEGNPQALVQSHDVLDQVFLGNFDHGLIVGARLSLEMESIQFQSSLHRINGVGNERGGNLIALCRIKRTHGS